MTRSCAWMFYDWPEGTLHRQMQILNTAFLRLGTVIAFKPMRKLIAKVTPDMKEK